MTHALNCFNGYFHVHFNRWWYYLKCIFAILIMIENMEIDILKVYFLLFYDVIQNIFMIPKTYMFPLHRVWAVVYSTKPIFCAASFRVFEPAWLEVNWIWLDVYWLGFRRKWGEIVLNLKIYLIIKLYDGPELHTSC